MGSFVIWCPKASTDLDKFVMVTLDETHPNLLHIDRDTPVILLQTKPDCYELRKGRWRIGDVIFCYDKNSGWEFVPRGVGKANHRRYRFPEGALRGKFKITGVYRDATYASNA